MKTNYDEQMKESIAKRCLMAKEWRSFLWR